MRKTKYWIISEIILITLFIAGFVYYLEYKIPDSNQYTVIDKYTKLESSGKASRTVFRFIVKNKYGIFDMRTNYYSYTTISKGSVIKFSKPYAVTELADKLVVSSDKLLQAIDPPIFRILYNNIKLVSAASILLIAILLSFVIMQIGQNLWQ